MIPIVTAAQMRALDEDTIQRIGVPGAALMETAGRAVFLRLKALSRDGALHLSRCQVVIAAGPGNNGGDGMVVGRYLQAAGIRVRLLLCADRARVSGDALLHLGAAEAVGLSAEVCTDADAATILRGLAPGDVIIDALLGTGLSRPAKGALAAIIQAMNESVALRVSVDLPSGLDGDRGEPAGGDAQAPAIVRADHTVTFAFPKLGLVTAPGFRYAGALEIADIGIPPGLADKHGVRAYLLDERCLQPVPAPRSPLGHKGSHGHLLVIAGSPGKTGAARLAAGAALRAGVGLLTLAAPPASRAALESWALEAMTAVYEPERAASLGALSAGKGALAIGPGIPTDDAMGDALCALLAGGEEPTVLDADALNLLAARPGFLRTLSRPLVLTPHPGEAARLLGTTSAAVQADRTAAVRALCAATGAVVLLKGARTLIAAPAADGEAQGFLFVCPSGNGAMATGGMGDVLTGIVGALLCRGVPPLAAACAAAYWHGRAGDLLAARRPPGSLLLGSEVIAALPDALLL